MKPTWEITYVDQMGSYHTKKVDVSSISKAKRQHPGGIIIRIYKNGDLVWEKQGWHQS